MQAQKCRPSFTHQRALDRHAFPPKKAHGACKQGQGLLLKIRGKSTALLLLPLILSFSLLIPYFPLRAEAHYISGTCLPSKQLQTWALPLRRSFSVKKRDRKPRRQLLLFIHSCLFQLHGPYLTRLLCPPLSPRVCSNPRPTELIMPSDRLIFCHPLLLLSSIFPSIRVFSVSWLFALDGQNIGASAEDDNTVLFSANGRYIQVMMGSKDQISNSKGEILGKIQRRGGTYAGF